jgi:error-prone DNA polymerase
VDFAHLHVASAYSMRHGASMPADLVARAAEHGQSLLALTDRDGVYGAVRFVQACSAAGIAPVLGVDLAVDLPHAGPRNVGPRNVGPRNVGGAGRPMPPAARPPSTGERLPDGVGRAARRVGTVDSVGLPPQGASPARGGAWVDPRHPRAVLLARDRRGWSSLCRLISAMHARRADERADARSDARSVAASLEQIAMHSDGLIALLGPHSPVAEALAARRPDLADALIAPWCEIFGDSLRIEIVSHRARSGTLSTPVAARLLGWARERGITPVLAHAVRYAEPRQGRIVDVLDATRRLVVLDERHRDRPNAQGFLASTAFMSDLADEIAQAAGAGRRTSRDLLAAAFDLAGECALTPADLGIGEVIVPELDVVTPSSSSSSSSSASVELRRDFGRNSARNSTLGEARRADALLRARCESALDRYLGAERIAARHRLEEELRTVMTLGFATYFLTVAEVVDLTRGLGIRVAARGSGAGSLINHLLGISGVDPMRHGLLMERFLTPLRRELPDIDIDVESARRLEVYDAIIERFGTERVATVSMMETYRVRHAIRDVGAALAMPPGEIDALAKAFPHIRARGARQALVDLPELRDSGIGRMTARGELNHFWDLVEGLDGLPRHIAMHPCGVLLSDATLLDRTPVEPSAQGYPMSSFDKDDVETLGLLKLDVLGVRMQSALAHAVTEVERIDGKRIDLDAVTLDDPATYSLIQSTRTLGCFQIESPGQRELIGKFAPEVFNDIIIDISLFRPGPVKSDMVTPFLRARQGWADPVYIHDDLRPILEETYGVVVFHEQVLRIVATLTGCSLAEADETRRSMGSPEGQDDVRAWFYPAALAHGYDLPTVERVWEVLRAFASFGFCKAHAAAFALPTYQSAWFKAHHPAAFLAGVLTHDPGMYPKRLILDDARGLGIAILGLDVNRSGTTYAVEHVAEISGYRGLSDPGSLDNGDDQAADGSYAIRISLADVKGMSEAEMERIVERRPYSSLADFWHRAAVSQPIAERLVLAGAFDSVHGIWAEGTSLRRRGRVTRRDLLLQVADLARGGPRRTRAESEVEQLTFESLAGDAPPPITGLPELGPADRVRTEMEILGLDVSHHVVDFYAPMLDALSALRPPLVRSRDFLGLRSQAEILIAGVKVAVQTPPVRSGRRVIFLTLDDTTGPVDAAFFDDVQGPYASTVFGSWLLLVRGELRRTGPRGVSLRATGAWDLGHVHEEWSTGGLDAIAAMLAASPRPASPEQARRDGEAAPDGLPRRVLVHASGFRQSPYADIKPADIKPADIKPAAGDRQGAPSKLWHSSPGSSGW